MSMKTKKKLISILLTVSMMLTLFPFAAFAEDAGAQPAAVASEIIYVDANVTGENVDGTADKPYKTLQAAIDAVDMATIVLQSDTDENVTVSEGKAITLDLNGFTLNGKTKASSPALTNKGTVTVKDSSGSNKGTIKREDRSKDGTYYTIANEGTMTIQSGTVTNKAGDPQPDPWSGSSLICNGAKQNAILNIEGGVIEQNNFIAVKNDECGTLNISGGTINSSNSQSVQNWCEATITGGTLNGIVSTWGYYSNKSFVGHTVIKDNAVINGNTYVAWHSTYQGDKVPVLEIQGGTVQSVATDNSGHGEIAITGGTFAKDVSKYLSDGYVQDENGVVAPLNADNAAAMIGATPYATFEKAVSAANATDNTTITLLKDVVVTETVKPEKNMTIDLNGKTIKGDDARVFQVLAGTLNLTGKGTVTTVIPENGKLLTTSSVIRVGDNVAKGEEATNNVAAGIILGKDVTIEAPDTYGVGLFGDKTVESAEINGTIHSVSKAALGGNGSTTHGETTMVINDTARLTADKAGAIYHPQAGTLTINGGEIIGTGGIEFKGGNAEIAISGNPLIKATGTVSHEENNNGTSTDGYAIAVVDNQNYAGGTKVNIAGGRIVGPMTVVKDNEGADKKGSITVNGGYFTENPSKYVAGGKAAVESNLAGFNWMIADATNPDIKPAVGEPDVTVSDKIAETDKEKVSAAANSVEATGLDDFAASAAQDVTAQQKTAAEAALKAEVSGFNDTHIYTQAYLDIEATAYDAQAGTMTLDITPMVQVVASTADEAKNIQLTGDHKNAVILKGSQKEMVAKGTVVITVTFPEGFVNNNDDIYVQHKGYEYTAKVRGTNAYTATFTNPHGFSPFTFSKTSQAKAKIGNQSYTSLQAAVDAAKDGETITLLNTLTDADLQVTVSGDSRTINFKNDTGAEKTLNINGGKLTIANNQTASYQYTASTGGGTVVKRYDVTLADTDNGTITATHKRASKNSTVTITATPADGYVVDAVTVTEKDGDKVEVTKKDDNKYTFKMPASDVTVKATFKAEQTEPEQPSGLPFTDVAKDAWYFPAVEYVFNNGLMNGTTATTFAPNVELNRAMMAAVLYNMEGGPACDKSGLFSDVADGKWYTDAVNWAASNNIVSGMPDGTYAPDQALTREQMASILYRYAEYKGIDVSARADLSTFTDGTTVSPWAQDVVQWAVAEKLMSGNGNELQPKGTASRAQVATVLMNYCENVAK
jgi:hypothetical protein